MGKRKKARKAPDALERVTVGIPNDLIERARNCAYHTPGVTLAALVRHGLEQTVARYERQNGGNFPRRRGELPKGRTVR